MNLSDQSRLLPFSYARDFSILAQANEHQESGFTCWITESTPATAVAEISRRYGAVQINKVTPQELENAIKLAYAGSGNDAAQVIDAYEADYDLARLIQEMPAVEDLLDSADDAPVIRMINALLTQAIREGASDIHIEPFDQISVVRFRIDGRLRDIVRPKKTIHAALISRIKIMSDLDIAEK